MGSPGGSAAGKGEKPRDADGQSRKCGTRFAPRGRGDSSRRHWRSERVACVVEPSDLAPSAESATGRRSGAGESQLGLLAGTGSVSAVQERRLSRFQMAWVV